MAKTPSESVALKASNCCQVESSCLINSEHHVTDRHKDEDVIITIIIIISVSSMANNRAAIRRLGQRHWPAVGVSSGSGDRRGAMVRARLLGKLGP